MGQKGDDEPTVEFHKDFATGEFVAFSEDVFATDEMTGPTHKPEPKKPGVDTRLFLLALKCIDVAGFIVTILLLGLVSAVSVLLLYRSAIY